MRRIRISIILLIFLNSSNLVGETILVGNKALYYDLDPIIFDYRNLPDFMNDYSFGYYGDFNHEKYREDLKISISSMLNQSFTLSINIKSEDDYFAKHDLSNLEISDDFKMILGLESEKIISDFDELDDAELMYIFKIPTSIIDSYKLVSGRFFRYGEEYMSISYDSGYRPRSYSISRFMIVDEYLISINLSFKDYSFELLSLHPDLFELRGNLNKSYFFKDFLNEGRERYESLFINNELQSPNISKLFLLWESLICSLNISRELKNDNNWKLGTVKYWGSRLYEIPESKSNTLEYLSKFQIVFISDEESEIFIKDQIVVMQKISTLNGTVGWVDKEYIFEDG